MGINPFNEGRARALPKADYENAHNVSEEGWQ